MKRPTPSLKVAAFVAVCLGVYFLAAPKQQDIDIKVNGASASFVNVVSRVKVDVHIRPAETDRWLIIATDPETSLSEIPLEGWDSPRHHTRWWVMQEPGEFEFLAAIGGVSKL